MAFVRRFPRSPYFYGSFIGPDGKRVVRSTKEASRRKAQLIANEWEEFARGKRADRQLLEIITELRGVIHPQEVEPSVTTRVFFDQWLERRAGEVAGATLSAYKGSPRGSSRSWSGRLTSLLPDWGSATSPISATLRERGFPRRRPITR